jgi:pre-mRNA-splicing factor ATP-dependent RNA helicase DHX38/PRP16
VAKKSLEEHRARKSRNEMANSRNERDRDESGKRAMDGFRERLNKNENGRGYDRGKKNWDEEGRTRDGGWRQNGVSQGNDYDRTARRDDRDRASTVAGTPSSATPSNSRVKGQSWDSTPTSSRNGGSSRQPSWDSTPRSVRGTPARTDRNEWDTPRRVPSGYGDESPGRLPPPSSVIDEKEWEEEQTKLDREWYNADEMGGEAGDGEFGGYDDYDLEKEAELVRRATGGGAKKRVTARQAAFNADNELWEDNRLALSGVTGQRRKLDFDALDDEEETRVHLLVHDLKPPFLDGRLAFTKQLDPINPIKDPTSDLAVFAKKGSQLVMERRALKEREKVESHFNFNFF